MFHAKRFSVFLAGMFVLMAAIAWQNALGKTWFMPFPAS